MNESQSPDLLEPFSTAHVERLRNTYARVLPLIGVWVATFLDTDWTREPWGVAANGWITLTVFASWALLRWSGQTLRILRGTLWLAFAGFCVGVFLNYNGITRPVGSPTGGVHFGLASLIIAAHTLHAPIAARLAALGLWGGASLAALAGLGHSWYFATAAPGAAGDVLRFLLAGAIAVSMMDIFSRLSNLQIRSSVQNSLLQQYALTDTLTELPNRRAFQKACEKEFAPAHRAGRPVSLIVLDIDRFKQVNDSHGHAAGDRVLRQLAQVVRSVIRPTDYPVRWGGDEFAVLLPDSNLSHARLMAERIRLTVESFPFDVGTVTVSLGAAQLSSNCSVTSLFQRADQALYQAKRAGRNRIEADQTDLGSANSVESLRLALDKTDSTPEPECESTPPASAPGTSICE